MTWDATRNLTMGSTLPKTRTRPHGQNCRPMATVVWAGWSARFAESFTATVPRSEPRPREVEPNKKEHI